MLTCYKCLAVYCPLSGTDHWSTVVYIIPVYLYTQDYSAVQAVVVKWLSEIKVK